MPNELRLIMSMDASKAHLKTHYFKPAFNNNIILPLRVCDEHQRVMLEQFYILSFIISNLILMSSYLGVYYYTTMRFEYLFIYLLFYLFNNMLLYVLVC